MTLDCHPDCTAGTGTSSEPFTGWPHSVHPTLTQDHASAGGLSPPLEHGGQNVTENAVKTNQKDCRGHISITIYACFLLVCLWAISCNFTLFFSVDHQTLSLLSSLSVPASWLPQREGTTTQFPTRHFCLSVALSADPAPIFKERFLPPAKVVGFSFVLDFQQVTQ